MYSSLRKTYLDNVSDFEKGATDETKILLRLSIARLVFFFAGLFGVILCFTKALWLGIVSSVVFLLCFAFLIRKYVKHSANREHYNRLVKINKDELSSLDGDISMFDDGESFVDPSHDFTYDIDIFGKGSLFQYLNRTVTAYGRYLLAQWLAFPYELSAIMRERAEAISELSDKMRWRQHFSASGMGRQLPKKDIDELLDWLYTHDDEHTKRYRCLRWLLPFFTLTSLVLLCCGILHYTVFASFVILNFIIVCSRLKKTGEIYEHLSGRFKQLCSLSSQLILFEKEEFTSALLNELKQTSSEDRQSGAVGLSELGKVVKMFDNRNNVMVFIIFNVIGLYDLHCVCRLSEWQKKYKKSIREWVEALGNVDALSSLANYCYNHRDFVFPDFSEDDAFFDAVALGHPLISDAKRVSNDFRINKDNICIITGANMAGKSTFLRTIAVNYILAMIGAPVCAKSMRYVPIKLFTSMRTTDSLKSGESYFYAELKRLKILVDRLETEKNIFFVLDEILKGTNSDDKRLGAAMFLKKIICIGCTGVIATHDTSLGDMEKEYPDKISNKSMEVEVNGDIIKFDYLLKPGMASNKNAVLLMRQMKIIDE